MYKKSRHEIEERFRVRPAILDFYENPISQ